ncbi:unnamed protein product [Rotaria sordida]|uniref:Uncharacterized protein n=1 Tax=Rotaria sordida TaxID=392033 RepID=A0A818SZ51_9BILA|nr:unnamed protein product [Rotaria sordida]CAF1171708.1 unnamed protein product [Rotaria sordida]CAF3675562.1 unnamed protein product [Rotaria sordida]
MPFFLQVILDTIPTINQIKDIRVEHPSLLLYSREVTYKGFLLKDYQHKFKSIVTCSIYLTRNLYLVSNIPTIFFNLHRIAIEEFYWREDIIEFLQNNIPNLQSLYIRTYSSILYQQSISKYVLKNVFKLDMNINIHSINVKCLGHMFPSLQRLSIQWDTFRQYPSIDGFQCKQFINTFYQNKYWISKQLIPTVWKPQYNSHPILKVLF